MKQLITAVALAAAFMVSAHAVDKAAPATPAAAASAAPATPATPATPAHADKPTAQQGKMKTCNADAKGKTGDERKAFMKECLSAKKGSTQQDKMKTCNADAKGKTGDERKSFMKECLSSKT